jgi:hypothetical protein
LSELICAFSKMSACLLLPYDFHMGGFHEADHPDLLQVCEAGQDWIDVRAVQRSV